MPTSHFITLSNRPIVEKHGEISSGSLQLHYWEWKGHQQTILICHGGSLHSRCYDRIINEGLHGFHVISLDFRGHGQSQKHPLPYPFQWFGNDVFQFIERLDLSKNNLIGIGHSLGGHALTLAAAIAPKQLFQSLLLLDPGIYSSDVYSTENKFFKNSARTASRKDQWSSIEEMISYMEKPDRLSHWPKDILQNYCTYGVDENFKLQCSPELELYLYRASVESDSDIYQIIKNSNFIHHIPIHVIRAARPFINDKIPVTPTAPDLAQWFKKGRDTKLKDGNHTFPLEEPDIVIDFVKEVLEANKHLHSHL